MIKNKSSDIKQFKRYQEVLGKDAPKILKGFKDIKYNNIDEWSSLKSEYSKVNYYNKVISNEPKITSDLRMISDDSGVELVGLDFRLKSKDSYLRKVGTDSRNTLDLQVIKETIENTNDIIRYTFQDEGSKLVDSYRNINNALVKEGYSNIRVKNFWNNKLSAYKGVNCIYSNSSGQKFEVQFHTPESFNLKNNELHKLYEEQRLDSTSIERKKK